MCIYNTQICAQGEPLALIDWMSSPNRYDTLIARCKPYTFNRIQNQGRFQHTICSDFRIAHRQSLEPCLHCEDIVLERGWSGELIAKIQAREHQEHALTIDQEDASQRTTISSQQSQRASTPSSQATTCDCPCHYDKQAEQEDVLLTQHEDITRRIQEDMDISRAGSRAPSQRAPMQAPVHVQQIKRVPVPAPSPSPAHTQMRPQPNLAVAAANHALRNSMQPPPILRDTLRGGKKPSQGWGSRLGRKLELKLR